MLEVEGCRLMFSRFEGEGMVVLACAAAGAAMCHQFMLSLMLLVSRALLIPAARGCRLGVVVW